MKNFDKNGRLLSLLSWTGLILMVFAGILQAQQRRQLTENERTVLRVKFGELLFFDKNLSLDGSTACATCHNPQKGFSDGLRTAVGIGNQVGTINTPTIYTAAFQPLQFHDGRTLGVDAQSLQPLTNPIEMGNDTVNQVVRRIAPRYNSLSRSLYGKNFDADVMAHAFAMYEGSIFSTTMPVNKRMSGYKYTFAKDPAAERGYQLFMTLHCTQCHKPPYFTDMAFHNTGISFVTGDDEDGRIGILPQGSDRTSDTVRAFKTPTLQGINASGPYTHSGNVQNLYTMVRLYNSGMAVRNNQGRLVKDRFLDGRIKPLGMTDAQCRDLARFLEVGFVSNVQTAAPTP